MDTGGEHREEKQAVIHHRKCTRDSNQSDWICLWTVLLPLLFSGLMYYVFTKRGEKENSNYNFFLQFSASQIQSIFIAWLFHKSESCSSLQQPDFSS